MDPVPSIREESRIDCILVRAGTAFWRQQGPVGCGVTVGTNPLQCNVGLTLLFGATRPQHSRPTWTRGHLIEACKAVHEGSKASSEENCVTEVRSAMTEWCAAHPRPKDHVELEQQVRNLERHLVKCLCDRGFADQPKKQADGNIMHALTAETLLLVWEKQIILCILPSDRPLTEMESEQRKMAIKKARTNILSDKKTMLEGLAEQATAAAEANDHGLVYRFVKRLAPPKTLKGAGCRGLLGMAQTQLEGKLRQRHCATSSEHLRCQVQVWHRQKQLKVALWQALARSVQSWSRSKSGNCRSTRVD